MNLEEKNIEKIKENAVNALNEADDKSKAIVDVVEQLTNCLFGDVKNKILFDFELSKSDEDYKKRLGLRVLNKEEVSFYQKLKNIKQAFNGTQDVTIPINIINIALNNARTSSKLLSFINIAPAGVQKWIVEEHSGSAVWGDVTAKIQGELSTTLKGIKIDVHKLSTYLVIPKSISDLGNEWVDKYFVEILTEALIIGCEAGILTGNGKTAPIGLYNKINEFTTNGEASEKDCR